MNIRFRLGYLEHNNVRNARRGNCQSGIPKVNERAKNEPAMSHILRLLLHSICLQLASTALVWDFCPLQSSTNLVNRQCRESPSTEDTHASLRLLLCPSPDLPRPVSPLPDILPPHPPVSTSSHANIPPHLSFFIREVLPVRFEQASLVCFTTEMVQGPRTV